MVNRQRRTTQPSVNDLESPIFNSNCQTDKITFADLFSGIGGFRIAFEQAGYECVYSCEINDHCRQVYFE